MSISGGDEVRMPDLAGDSWQVIVVPWHLDERMSDFPLPRGRAFFGWADYLFWMDLLAKCSHCSGPSCFIPAVASPGPAPRARQAVAHPLQAARTYLRACVLAA